MIDSFFQKPILSSPYEHPGRHWELESGQPIEAVETLIWLTEVAPAVAPGRRFLDHLAKANQDANPGLPRLALKLATGAGKTTVMAMVIAWQTINAVRRPNSPRFTRGFLVVTPGLTIKDRLRVLQPNDPDSYYKSRELVPCDLVADLDRARIVITNFHAFKRRETLEISKGGRSLLQGRGKAGALDPLATVDHPEPGDHRRVGGPESDPHAGARSTHRCPRGPGQAVALDAEPEGGITATACPAKATAGRR